jgi:hypothetical protein
MRRMMTSIALVSCLLLALVCAHSEEHIDDSPHAESLEDTGPAEHLPMLDPEEQAAIDADCTVCRELVVPTLREAIESSGSDHDAKTVVHDALEKIAHSHSYDHSQRAVSRREGAGSDGEADEHIEALVSAMLWDVAHSRSLYALVDLWHNYSPERRTHFTKVLVHAVCACHDDEQMMESDVRMHEYLKEYESAVQSALYKYGGHPEHDHTLKAAANQAPDETFLDHDEELPDEHESIAEASGRGEGDSIGIHQHAPHSDSHETDDHHAAGYAEKNDEF